MENRYLRLVYCLTETCSKTARSLVLFYLERDKPEGYHEEWTLDHFLYQRRTDPKLRYLNPKQESILFPGYMKVTDINKWDISVLFIVLELFTKDTVICKDIFFIKKMRNSLFHAASTSITDEKYNEFKEKILVFSQNCCDILNDQQIVRDVEMFFQKTEKTYINNEQNEAQMMKGLENWCKSDPFFKCKDSLPSEIGLLMKEVFRKIKGFLQDIKFEIPDVCVGVRITNCKTEISELVYKQLLDYMCKEVPLEGMDSKLWEAIKHAEDALLDKHRRLVEIRRGCLTLRVQCSSFEGIWYLLSDCITGYLSSCWSDIQDLLREQHRAPNLTIDLGMTSLEVLCCIEELVDGVSRAITKQSCKELPQHPDTIKESSNQIDCIHTDKDEGSLESNVLQLKGETTMKHSESNDEMREMKIVTPRDNSPENSDNCYPCFFIDKTKVVAFCVCKECQHRLCIECLKHHKKTMQTRNHIITRLKQIGVPQSNYSEFGVSGGETTLYKASRSHSLVQRLNISRIFDWRRSDADWRLLETEDNGGETKFHKASVSVAKGRREGDDISDHSEKMTISSGNGSPIPLLEIPRYNDEEQYERRQAISWERLSRTTTPVSEMEVSGGEKKFHKASVSGARGRRERDDISGDLKKVTISDMEGITFKGEKSGNGSHRMRLNFPLHGDEEHYKAGRLFLFFLFFIIFFHEDFFWIQTTEF